MLQNVNYIVTAKDYDKSRGGKGSGRDWIFKCRDAIAKERGVNIPIFEEPKGEPVLARVYNGQWIADCDCGCNAASFVDPDFPFFFSFGCGNRLVNGHLRPVIFPPEWERLEIERLLLERPVNDTAGLTDLERVGMAEPILFKEMPNGQLLGLGRNWEPYETLGDLKEQNELVSRWRKELKSGKVRK